MTICDTGPLVALLHFDDPERIRCQATMSQLDGPLITTWVCFTEAMHFLGKLRGWEAQQNLWQFLRRGALELHSITHDEELRMEQLMEQYRDAPMDIADASLVALAETLGSRRIFTLDSHFHAYRINQRDAFIVVP